MKKKLVLTLVILSWLSGGCIKLKKSEPGQDAPAASEWASDQIVIEGELSLTTETSHGLTARLTKMNDQDVYIIRAREVIFKNNSVLKTEGKNLRIETDHLVVESKAVLKTFDSADKAELDQAGRAGGKIVLLANRAEGTLSAVLNGENGGDGSAGPEPTEELRGAPGVKGSDGFLRISSENTACEMRPTQGSLGERGKPGFSGQDGQSGGDSAALAVQISDKQNFAVLVIEHKPGLGGIGGIGGRGGDAGLPGADGQVYTSEPVAPAGISGIAAYCPLVKFDRKPAQVGPQGQTGKRGPDGKLTTLL